MELRDWLCDPYLFRLQKSVNLYSFGKRSSNWVFTVSLGGMSEISDKKKLPRKGFEVTAIIGWDFWPSFF